MKYLILWAFLFSIFWGCDSKTDLASIEDAQKPAEKENNRTEFSLLAWNIDSGGNDPHVVSEQLRSLGIFDFYCLSEVSPKNLETYIIALGPGFAPVSGQNGRSNHLQIIYNERRFELLEQHEMMGDHNFVLSNGSLKSGLFARFLDRTTNQQLIVMENHLSRRDAKLRVEQAIDLREWARAQKVAVINISNLNLENDSLNRNGNDAFHEMLLDDVWSWVQPSNFVGTKGSGSREEALPSSMLDSAFVSGPAKDWQPICRVIVEDGDFSENETTSDHRPIELLLNPG